MESSEPEASSSALPRTKPRRDYGASCLVCRQRKISCDRKRPACSFCLHSQSPCHYGGTIRKKRSNRPEATPSGSISRSSRPDQMSDSQDVSLRTRVARLENLVESLLQSEHRITHSKTVTTEPSPKFSLVLDANGNVMARGLTDLDQQVSDLVPTPTIEPIDPSLSPFFQALSSAKHVAVSPEHGDSLLQAFFRYQEYALVEPSLFLRDMALGGRFFSNFLLLCIYSSGARMVDGLSPETRRVQGDLFARLAKEMYTKDLESMSTLPTIQGLLLLSGRECAMGSVRQGWIYAGLAFRLMEDLGMHLPPSSVYGASDLSAEETATRERVYWSAFVWDKTISLTLGREPSLSPRRGRSIDKIEDFADETEAWIASLPHADVDFSFVPYSYHPSRRMATFRCLAELALILHDLIKDQYADSDEQPHPHATENYEARLKILATQVEASIPLPGEGSSPPPYVVMLYMVLHATWIILYRPSLETSNPQVIWNEVQKCVDHSAASHKLIKDYRNTFKRRMGYLTSYASVVTAKFNIRMLRSDNLSHRLDALERLREWFEIMETTILLGSAMEHSVKNALSMTKEVIFGDPSFASSPSFQWIISRPDPTIRSPEETFLPTLGANDLNWFVGAI